MRLQPLHLHRAFNAIENHWPSASTFTFTPCFQCHWKPLVLGFNLYMNTCFQCHWKPLVLGFNLYMYTVLSMPLKTIGPRLQPLHVHRDFNAIENHWSSSTFDLHPAVQIILSFWTMSITMFVLFTVLYTLACTKNLFKYLLNNLVFKNLYRKLVSLSFLSWSIFLLSAPEHFLRLSDRLTVLFAQRDDSTGKLCLRGIQTLKYL